VRQDLALALARPVDRCYNNGMSILRRNPRKPDSVRGPMTLELHPKDRRGATSRHHQVMVWSYTEDIPKVSVVIQDQAMLAGALLDEDQVGMLIQGLLDALEASKANASSGT